MEAMKMNWKEKENLPPHVLIFPYPVQGHLNSMLNLAHLFCLAHFHVTFIISDFSHRRLLRHTTVPATFAAYPGFQFLTLPDGLPEDHPRAGERVMEFLTSFANITVPLFKKMMVEQDFLAPAAARRRPVTCFVADGLMSFAADFAEENGIPLIYFRTATASYLWALFRFPQLLEAQEIPFQDFLASSGRRRPVTCFIADGFFGFASDFVEEKGLPLVTFRTPSASYF